ncbi:MAG TPA: hypothetical protein DDW84_02150 [Phycisphaerales bacterium]|nr:MAG: hypothetical protein A2Y13_06195 [Planctomycetes bacterium GWC2_45_44]HBG77638.1 hypothetical protein [Phycisphaerales bacterium]HBR20847.1 hypothetical protein [Phycisphaerales bacterium]
MKTAKILTVLAITAIISAVCFAEAEKVDLKLRLSPGESHEMKMTQNQNITQSVNGQEMKMTQLMEMLIGLDCKSVDANGIMLVEMTYKAVKMKMDGAGQKMEFDSANPKPADPNKPQEKIMAGIFSAMVGCKFGMQVSPTGETAGVTGVKEMMTKMKEKMGDSNEAKMIDAMFDKMFDEKELKSMAGSLMVIFPKAPAAVGDTWYDTMSMNVMMPIDIETTYIFKSRKDGIAYIDAVAKMDMGDAAKPIEMGPMKMSMQLAGTMNSANQVDEKTGLVKKSEMTSNFSGVMKMDANEQMPQGMSIPMTIVGTAIVELIK